MKQTEIKAKLRRHPNGLYWLRATTEGETRRRGIRGFVQVLEPPVRAEHENKYLVKVRTVTFDANTMLVVLGTETKMIPVAWIESMWYENLTKFEVQQTESHRNHQREMTVWRAQTEMADKKKRLLVAQATEMLGMVSERVFNATGERIFNVNTEVSFPVRTVTENGKVIITIPQNEFEAMWKAFQQTKATV